MSVAFTADERAELNALLIRAAETGDVEAFAVLEKLAGDPEAYRAAVGGFDGDGEDEPTVHESSALIPKKVTVHRHDGTTYQQTKMVRPDEVTPPQPVAKTASPAVTSRATRSPVPEKPRPANPAVAKKLEAAKATKIIVNADVQRFAEEQNERAVSHAVGGVSLPDGEPVDVVIPADKATLARWRAASDAHRDALAAYRAGTGRKPGAFRPEGPAVHGVELKTMFSNAAGKISMKMSARKVKAAWERRTGREVSTVVIDDSAVFNAGGPGKHDFSKRKVYYRRGFGNYAVNAMLLVPNGLEGVRVLLDTPSNQLPDSARRLTPRGRAAVPKRRTS